MALRHGSALILLLATALPLPAAGQAEGTAEPTDSLGILGSVVDRETRRALEGVAVRLDPTGDGADTLSPPPPALTDDEGRFAFSDLPDAVYRIQIERFGYQTLVDSVAYEGEFGLRIEVALAADALELEPLLVVTEARSRVLAMSGFYGRRDGGIGRFLSREEIQERDPLRVSDLFRTMPGVRVTPESMSHESIVLLRGGCVPDVFLDGVRTAKPFPVDRLLAPDHLAGVEVYHASEVPPHYGPSNCGAILVWTYVPNPGLGGDRWSWGKLLGAVAILGTVILLTR
jgi:hypothetical protein